MFIGAGLFLQSLHQFRTCYVRGRYGGGKTLLSVAVANYFHQSHSYHIYSNLELDLPGYVETLPTCTCDKCSPSYERAQAKGKDIVPKHHTFMIYDEAWLSFGAGTAPSKMRAYLAYIRKVDLIMMMPSVMPLNKSAAQLWVERRRNWGGIGIPLWVYEWGVTGQSSKKSGGIFCLAFPQRYFGTYDTDAQPEEIEGLFNATIKKKTLR